MFGGNVKSFLKRMFKKKQMGDDFVQQEEETEQNPYLWQIREIVEQVLKKKKISYEKFAPILIDGGSSDELLDAARRLSEGLNRMMIWTDRPAYFERFADNMYEEQGLIVEFCAKEAKRYENLSSAEISGNVILDFERPDECVAEVKFGQKIYIPVFKRRWESAGNLDIAVPIGYNTLIVRGVGSLEKNSFPDKFEQAFYEKE